MKLFSLSRSPKQEWGKHTRGLGGLERRERDKPPRVLAAEGCPSAGDALCLAAAAPITPMSMAHTGKSAPTPVPIGLPGCKKGQVSQQGRAPRLGKAHLSLSLHLLAGEGCAPWQHPDVTTRWL